MKKLALLASAATLALSTGGCAQVDSFLQNDIINPTAALFTNPQTQVVVADINVAFTKLAADTQALACTIAAGSSVGASIESNSAFNASASLQGTTLKIYVASEAVCTSLSGIIAGSVTAPAGSAVVTSASPAS